MTEEDKELAEVKREIRELLESLSPSDLEALLGMPLLFDEVLEQAEHSPLLAERIMQLADAEYETLSPEEKERGRQLVARLLAQHKSKKSPRKVVESQPRTKTSSQKITDKAGARYAASTERARLEKNAKDALEVVGGFSMAGTRFEVEEDLEGQLFLNCPAPIDAAAIWLGPTRCRLQKESATRQVQILDISRNDIGRFLRRHLRDPARFPITFETPADS